MMPTGARRAALVLAVALALGSGVLFVSGAGASAGASEARTRDGALGPGSATIRIRIHNSAFSPTRVRVREHTTVRFVLVNRDPIGHEFIVGSPEVHARHAAGNEPSHPPVPGEVSIPAHATASTTYDFHEPGAVEFACHLPGHYQYGMRGMVVVTRE